MGTRQLQEVDPTKSIAYYDRTEDLVRARRGRINRDYYEETTGIVDGNSSAVNSDHLRICGTWNTPDLPVYLQQVINGESEDITEAQARDIKTTFEEGHKNIMRSIQRAIEQEVVRLYPEMNGTNLIKGNSEAIAAIHQDAVAQLDRLNDTIRAKTTALTGQ